MPSPWIAGNAMGPGLDKRYETISVCFRSDIRLEPTHAMPTGPDTPLDQLPPLKAAWFHILLALSEEPLHGFAIRESVEERTEGKVKLYPANLYGSIRDMTELALLEALSEEEQPDDDQRRQYYRLTERGRELLRMEADRLQQLVDAARASRALAR